ncbi:serine/threonine protein kinase [Marinomonas ostreistagni]|uniref:serine/threonine protein kinase n=1 Tax=Marinomonas ostreistagni TaxID=359209 RepID=UPI00194FD186|nr:serine/threonine protein kinase [Marinomonas ostreistagni]MBM6549627.1 serine/threonine protein kinase [Marinomonas ostreistagni]
MQHPYSQLSPDLIMDALESIGLYSDYRLYPLNSYENRVYQVGIEDSTPVIAKFYRPGRWNKAQIQEEHDLLQRLAADDIAVAKPLLIEQQSVFEHQGFYFSVTPKLPGDAPEAGNLDQLFQLGELIGAMHHASAAVELTERPTLSPVERMQQASQLVLQSEHLPASLRADYVRLIEQLIVRSQQTLDAHPKRLRCIHGDCHRSNVLNHQGQLTLLDFDDCRMGYAVQDLWLHISDHDTKRQQLSELIEGYETYTPFDTRELDLIDAFMAERSVVYTAWIAQRWQDPAFPKLFPHFQTKEYWQQHIADLEDIYKNWGNWR